MNYELLQCSICKKYIGNVDKKGKLQLTINCVYVSIHSTGAKKDEKKIYNCSIACLRQLNIY